MAPTSLPGTTDRRLASLLTLFANNATIAISGARIAKEIGVSRSTVWRWVERLREVGVRVKGRPNTGYFLERVPDILTPDLLRQQLKGSMFGKRIHHFFRTDSTNRVAMQLGDRKSTRLNSSHLVISYAVFCLKKKKKNIICTRRKHTSNTPARLRVASRAA